LRNFDFSILKLDPVQVKSAMPHYSGKSFWISAVRRKKFHVDFSAYTQVGDGKNAHAYVAYIDAQSVHASSAGEDANGSVEQLALSTATVWLEDESGEHSRKRLGTR